MSHSQNRRSFIKTATALAATSALGFPAVHASANDKRYDGKVVKLLTWADDTGLAVLENIAKTFEAKTGAKVIADRTGATSEMIAKIKAGGDRPQYDVLTVAGVGATTLGDAGLLAKPDLNQLPNLADVDERFRTDPEGHGIGYLLWTGGLVYSTKTFKEAPTSYEEMFDEKYANRIFLPPSNWSDALDTVVAAAKTQGAGLDNIDVGFEKLAELQGRILTFGENPTQIAELFRTGELDIGAVYPPALLAKQIKDPSFGIGSTYDLDEGFFSDLMYTIVPKAHPGDDDVIHAFLNHTLDPEVQGVMAEAVLNGPINQKAILSDEAKASPYIIKPEQLGEKAIIHDQALLSEQREDMIKRYTRMFM